ncbi:hypothetical protein Hypma_008536 [Hypsizygus marmoreus]|uniref:Uncharacterized protein n=1 Tax=Hypsizygus marmoreus TaxID=39966 RepID=A0A369JTB1_HYPMA|nr:hypothetical protein Hypma_008536 [Hypsizygus marmoreus]
MRNPNANRWRDAFSTWQDCDNIPHVALCHRYYLGKMTNYVLSINPPQPADEYASVYPDFIWWYDPLNVRRAVFCPFCDSLWAVDDPQ